MNVNGMSMKSRVIIRRNTDLDQQALLIIRPRIERRASVQIPTTPNRNSTDQSSRSAPNTPKSILKASKSKPFTLVGKKRSTNPISSLLPATSTSDVQQVVAVSPPTPDPDNQSDHGSVQPLTPESGQNSAITPPPTPTPTQNRPNRDDNEDDEDEFEDDIQQLNERDTELYATDEEDI